MLFELVGFWGFGVLGFWGGGSGSIGFPVPKSTLKHCQRSVGRYLTTLTSVRRAARRGGGGEPGEARRAR